MSIAREFVRNLTDRRERQDQCTRCGGRVAHSQIHCTKCTLMLQKMRDNVRRIFGGHKP